MLDKNVERSRRNARRNAKRKREAAEMTPLDIENLLKKNDDKDWHKKYERTSSRD